MEVGGGWIALGIYNSADMYAIHGYEIIITCGLKARAGKHEGSRGRRGSTVQCSFR